MSANSMAIVGAQGTLWHVVLNLSGKQAVLAGTVLRVGIKGSESEI